MSYRQRDSDSTTNSRNHRSRSCSPPPWRKEALRRPRESAASSSDDDRRRHDRNMKEQTRLNALQEAEQARQWVDQEDTFVLKQAKKKAEKKEKK